MQYSILLSVIDEVGRAFGRGLLIKEEARQMIINTANALDLSHVIEDLPELSA